MKNTIPYLLTVILAIALSLNSCENTFNPIESKFPVIKTETKISVNILNGNVISKVYLKEYNSNSKIISFIEYGENGSIISQSNFEYIKSEKIELKYVFDINGVIIRSENNNYTYSVENGNLLKLTKLDNKGKIIATTSYTYDIKGNILKEFEVSSDSNITVCTKDFVYNYNVNGSLEGLTVKDAISNTIITKDSINYLTKTNVLEKYNFDNIGTITKINRFYYNTSGKISYETESDFNNKITKKYIYNYTFF